MKITHSSLTLNREVLLRRIKTYAKIIVIEIAHVSLPNQFEYGVIEDAN